MDNKSQLKKAREAIKNKDFSTTIDICKNILKDDTDNYLALVFLGLSLQETNLNDESERLFRKATKINPDNLLGWNGLANYYEKLDTPDARIELTKIYTILIGLETSEKKLIEYCQRLCSLFKYANVEDICRTIYDKVENGNYSESTLISSRTSLANILKQSNDLSDDILNVYENILSSLVSNQETVSPDHYSQYLMILYKKKDYENLIKHTIRMYKIFPNDVTSMNWICKINNELYVEDKPSVITEFVNIEEIYLNLLKIEPKNAMALFTKAICDYKLKLYDEVKENLIAVVTQRAGLVHAWILLTRVNMLLHSYNDASETANFTIKLLKSPKISFDLMLIQEIHSMFMESLSRSSECTDWEKAVEHYDTLDENLKEFCLPHFTRANINLGNTLIAKTSITLLEKKDENYDLSCLLRAQLFRKEKKYMQALTELNRKENRTPEWYLELGITYLSMMEMDKCLLPLLKAAKNDPNNHYCFYYLGLYYRELKEYDKARRCYEKSYKLCPGFGDAGMELSKIYRIQKKWETNNDLLQTITEDSINKQNMWAWLQMGVNLMEQGDYENAIEHLRLVSRIDSENQFCWEALADAYLSRGAYTSAQKAYENALKLSNNSLYPALQIAIIKKDLGLIDEALMDFNLLIESNENCMLTLVGLSETCIKKAKECLAEQRLGTARDYIQFSIESITFAIQQWSEVVCVWKIFGDCCMITGQLPVKFSWLSIKRSIDEGAKIDGTKIIRKENLLQLAARCYSKALLLIDDNHLIWHDLAVCYLLQSQNCNDKKEINNLLIKAQGIIQHCVTINQDYWPHWNLLGNIMLNFDPPNYAIAQHAFIKAVLLDHNCAPAWTNLGVLYFINDDIKLANKAFESAQRSDPNYVQSWIGQGFLAEMLSQDDEAMDLYRHSLSLNFHPQGAISYGYWVCRKLLESSSAIKSYVIEKLYAIPVACDALTWYTEKYPIDSCGWNILGVLMERMGLLMGSADSYRKSIELVEDKYSDFVKINYGRILTRLGLYKEAIKICNDVQESSFNSGIWYALALYKDHQLEESSSIYIAIAKYLVKDEFSMGDVVACMAIIKYALGEPQLAKTIITESFTHKKPNARVMYALIALGVVLKDTSLVTLALRKINILKDVPNSIEDFANLLSYVYIHQGNYMKAITATSELIHLIPNHSGLRLALSLTFLYLNDTRYESPQIANNISKIALKLKNDKNNHREISKILCGISTSSILLKNKKEALITAQKALHCTPNAKECWLVLNESFEMNKEKYLKNFNDTNKVLYFGKEFDYIRNNCIF